MSAPPPVRRAPRGRAARLRRLAAVCAGALVLPALLAHPALADLPASLGPAPSQAPAPTAVGPAGRSGSPAPTDPGGRTGGRTAGHTGAAAVGNPPAASAASGGAAHRAPSAPVAHSATEIRRFLTGFYGKHGPSARQRREDVAQELRRKVADAPDQDLLLCAPRPARSKRAAPDALTVTGVATAPSAHAGWATVTARWPGRPAQRFTVFVDLDGRRRLKLLDVACPL